MAMMEVRWCRLFFLLRWAAWGVALVGVGVGVGCRSEGSRDGATGPQGDRYTIVTTIAMVGDVVQQVAGPRAEVRGLIGAGVDPHLYKPTSTDVKRLQAADVVFYNGLMLEGKLSHILEDFGAPGKPVVAVAEAIAARGDYAIVEDGAERDPHLWMDVGGWMQGVEVIAEVLAGYDAPHAVEYRTRAEAYLEDLRRLDAYARRCLASIPPEQRVLVTAHDAFGYFGRAYGLEVRGIQGLSTEAEAGVRDIEELVDFLVRRRIPAVFVESSVSDKNVRALIEGARARGHDLRIGGELYSDAMGAAGTYEGSYIGMLDHNITTLTRALGGDAPEGGLDGRLSEGVGTR